MHKILCSILALLSITTTATAQFYYNGRGSATIKWDQINTDKYRLIYPQEFTQGARRYSTLLDSIYPYINYNFSQPIRKIPIILRTESQLSNGFVVWAPKREELVTNSSGNTYALAWDKQLVAHESRHVAQMSLMRTGITKVMSWILGEAGISVGLLVVSKWQLEGDATLAETQMAEYGRGLQPEFTLGYRGLAMDDKLNFKNIDQWVAGSYHHYVPDIYQYGYQVMSAAETYLSPTIWNDVVRYSAKYPILISPRTWYLQRHYKTTYKKIAQRAFRELDSIWRPTFAVHNNFRIITSYPKLHTNYNYPMQYGRSIIATKVDMKRPTRFVVIDSTTMREKNLYQTGTITSPPIIYDSTLYWTEYKPHPIWELKNYSVIRSIDLNSGKESVYGRNKVNYYVTPLPDGSFATISNDVQSNSFIRITDSHFKNELQKFTFDRHTTLHSLTWDNTTQLLYFIALDDRGMWIGSLDRTTGRFDTIKAPSAVSLRELKAKDGVLYFGSIASGKDEIHTLNLDSMKEYQQTTSKLGSSNPSYDDQGGMLFTSYTGRGWAIARGTITDTTEVQWSRLPKNILNPVRYKWDIPKLDTLTVVADSSSQTKEPKRFRRALRSFNVNSWAPIAVNGTSIMSERSLSNLAVGATAFFQSTLSEMRGFATFGWLNNASWFKMQALYSGLPVQMDISVEYGGGTQNIYIPYNEKNSINFSDELKPYFGINAGFSLPLNLTKGANQRLLRPSINVNYSNSRVYHEDLNSFSDNLVTYVASLYWSSIRTKGYRSLMPRLGYTAQLNVVGALRRDFSTIFNITSYGYLPGFGQTHSLKIAGTLQHQLVWNDYKLSAKSIVPRGVVNNRPAQNYGASSIAYALPICYPDWGWDGAIYIRRLWSELFFDSSIGTYYQYSKGKPTIMKDYSFGCVLHVDTNLLRTMANSFSFTFARSNQNNFWFGFNIGFDF